MKNKKLLNYVLAFSIFMVFLILFINSQLKQNNNEETTNNNTTEYLTTITYNDLDKLIKDKEDFILFVGKASCPACQQFTPNFKAVLNKYKINANYLNLESLTNEELEAFDSFIKVANIPTVAFIYDGVEVSVVNRITGAVSQNEIIAKLRDNDYIK